MTEEYRSFSTNILLPDLEQCWETQQEYWYAKVAIRLGIFAVLVLPILGAIFIHLVFLIFLFMPGFFIIALLSSNYIEKQKLEQSALNKML